MLAPHMTKDQRSEIESIALQIKQVMKDITSFDRLCQFENNSNKYNLYNRDFYKNFHDPHQRNTISLLEAPDGQILTDETDSNKHIFDHFAHKFRASNQPPAPPHGTGTVNDPNLDLGPYLESQMDPNLDLDLDPDLARNLNQLCTKFGLTLPSISDDIFQLLSQDLYLADFTSAVKMLNPLSAPGPDKLQTKLI